MNDEPSSKRSYDNSLRLQQQEMTHNTIMSSVRELILEGRLSNFTIQEVANKAGVSYGTVYRHFSSREALLEGLIHWGLETSLKRIPPYPERLEDIPGWAERTVPVLMPELTTVKAIDAARSAVYNRQVPESSRERDVVFERLVEHAAPELSEVDRKAMAAALRVWASIRTWAELHVRYGLDEEMIVRAVSEAMQALVDRIHKLVETSRGAQG